MFQPTPLGHTVDGNQKVAAIQYDNPLGTEEDLLDKLTTGREGVGGEGSFQVNMDPQSYSVRKIMFICCAALLIKSCSSPLLLFPSLLCRWKG